MDADELKLAAERLAGNVVHAMQQGQWPGSIEIRWGERNTGNGLGVEICVLPEGGGIVYSEKFPIDTPAWKVVQVVEEVFARRGLDPSGLARRKLAGSWFHHAAYEQYDKVQRRCAKETTIRWRPEGRPACVLSHPELGDVEVPFPPGCDETTLLSALREQRVYCEWTETLVKLREALEKNATSARSA